MRLLRELAAEFIGTTALLATVVGSGIMGVQLADGNDAIALLANAAATAGMLFVLITVLGPISGAHFNPAVTGVMALRGEMTPGAAMAYVFVQAAGAILGVCLAHLMFELPVLEASAHARTGAAQWLSESVATFGLVLTILVGRVRHGTAMPMLVAAYIFAAYWFTSSTSFANPAVTLARAWTDTFAGIRPSDVSGFVLAQLAGAVLAVGVGRILIRQPDSEGSTDSVATST